MLANKLAASVLAVLMTLSAVGPVAMAAQAGTQTSQQESYTGTHVSFDTTETAVVDYSIHGETVMESVTVQSKSEVDGNGDVAIGGGLSAVTDISGSDVAVDAETETSVAVAAESGAELHAHDNERGVLVVRAGEESQYVNVNLTGSSRAESESTSSVVVTTEDGAQGTFIVIGDGEVTVNDNGNVSAELGDEGRLVFRAYPEERDSRDEQQEQLIADGTATAEVYVSQDGGDVVADTISYGGNTAVSVTEKTQGRVTMNAERTEHEGKVVITTVADEVIESADELSVTVDGEAATRASSESELRSAIGSDDSKFLVHQQSSATASASVLVAVNHFSSREIVLTSSGSSGSDGYVGSHTSFELSNTALVDYAVDGETIMESVKTQSKNEAENAGGIDIGADLSAITGFAGASLSSGAESETAVMVASDSGAEFRAHDNQRGILTLHSGDEGQYVAVNLSASSRAASESDERVVVTTEDDTKGAFIVVGDGEITVNERGNLTADLASDSKLVFRSYGDERNDEDRQEEQLIANGTAAAEVFVMQESEGSSETVADVVTYSEDTTVRVTERSEGMVSMTAERSEQQGKIVIVSVSDAIIPSTDDVDVTVDGEVATRASSYSELEGAVDDGGTSKFLVRQESSAEATADVLVAVNHFSERQITMTDTDSSGSGSDGQESDDTDDGTAENDGTDGDSETTDADGPGFGVAMALIALVGLALVGFRRI